MSLAIRLENVTHEYAPTDETAAVRALDGVDLTIAAGDFAILMGPSGSGKSTLLNIVGAVDRPTGGRALVGDDDIAQLGEAALTQLRRKRIGFVFQFFNLLPTLTVEENIAFPLALAGIPRNETRERVAEVIRTVDLTGRAKHYPNQLSGGEMQRVAIGRAVVHRPDLVIADEPTGNLDSHTGETILQLLQSVHESHRPTIVMATHSDHAASFGDYIVRMIDGRIEGQPESR
ncbi:MAG: ABC transporter ATP-binding protein [Thermoanaerobaculia bacterium]